MTDIVSKADFARRCGVTGACVSQWLRDGMIGHEALLGKGRHARVRAELALAMLRQRLDLTRSATNLDGFQLSGEAIAAGHPKSELVAARTRTAGLQAELLQMRLAREHGEVIPRAAATAAVEALGRATQRAFRGIPAWAEEITAATQTGGLGAVSALLRAKSAELLNSVADLIMAEAELIEEPGHED